MLFSAAHFHEKVLWTTALTTLGKRYWAANGRFGLQSNANSSTFPLDSMKRAIIHIVAEAKTGAEVTSESKRSQDTIVVFLFTLLQQLSEL